MTITYDQFVRENRQTNNKIIENLFFIYTGIKFDTKSLWDRGEEISKEHIVKGDLLYFEADNEDSCVTCIAESKENFMHFINGGMYESSLNDDRWACRFIGARRVVNL
ncbi:hypothetical protein [Paenibacillus silvae]|uniref:Uncharacterized protein n=1 Tax=Paenibacillus silvae TaxID=1325358 RepID=A0A2W6NNK6_9BACL|nr:hypothetical protein [Paenibacillus silvae]PZT57345.1 hypothetical protein DN757_01425 [Paenibacillus silvae]